MIDRRSGWGSSPLPPIYHTAEKIAQQLRAEARRVSDDAWSFEALLRSVRLASTAEDKKKAVERLELAVIDRIGATAFVTSVPVLTPTE